MAVKTHWTWGQSAGKASMNDDEMLEEPSETSRSISTDSRLEAQWVVGFVDGEGCFYVGINAQPEMKAGCQVLP